jgi:Thioredoxin-like
MFRRENSAVFVRRSSFARPRGVPWLIFALTTCVAVSGPSHAAESNAVFSAKITLSASMEAALEAARKRASPILVVMHTDQEAACARSERDVYQNSEFASATRAAVVVAASPDDHGGVDGCPRFPGMTCEQHVAAFEALFPRYFAHGEEVVIPQHLVLNADGALIERVEYLRTKSDLVRLVKDAAAYVADPEKALEAREKATLKSIQDLGGKSGAAAEKAARSLLRDLGTVYGESTIALLTAKGTTKAKLALLPFLEEKKREADAVFVALLSDDDAKVRAAVEVAVREFPVICIEARQKLRGGALATGG